MNTPSDDTGNRPQVIDLEAEDLDTPAPQPDTGDTTARPDRRGSSAAYWVIAALVIGGLGGGWLYRDLLSGYFPSNEMTALKRQVAALAQNHADLADRLAAVKQGADGATGTASAASDAAGRAAEAAEASAARLDALSAKLGTADEQTAALEAAVGALRADLDQLRSAITTAPATSGAATAADGAVLAALGQRLAALEKDVASLKAGRSVSDNGTAATTALSQALSDLKAKVAAGTSFQPEYERIARMVPAAPGLDIVAADAAQGVPDGKGLAAELRAAIPALPRPAAAPAADDSYWGMAVSALSGIISIRPIGDTDWPQLADKAAALAEAGDLTQAIGLIDAAEGERPVAISQWRARAAARLRLEQAVSEVSEAVLRQIAAGGGAAP